MMKGMIFGSSLFVGGIISLTLLLTSDNNLSDLKRYFILLDVFTITGFVTMVVGLLNKETIKNIFENKYDITGRPK